MANNPFVIKPKTDADGWVSVEEFATLKDVEAKRPPPVKKSTWTSPYVFKPLSEALSSEASKKN